MADPCRIIPRNAFDLATLTATFTPATGTSLSNLKNNRRARICRISPASGGTHSIKGTWNGTGYTVGGVGLDRFNFEPNALVRFRGWLAADWTGSPLLDTGSVAPYNAAALGSFTWALQPLGSSIFDGYLGYKYWAHWFSTQQAIASFQFDVTDTGNSAGYLDIGRAVCGEYIQTTYNADFGMSAGWQSSSEQEETDGGSLLSMAKLPRRSLKGSLALLNNTERADLYNFTRYVDKNKTFAISLAAGETGSLGRDMTILQAKFTDLPDLTTNFATAHSMPFSLVEA